MILTSVTQIQEEVLIRKRGINPGITPPYPTPTMVRFAEKDVWEWPKLEAEGGLVWQGEGDLSLGKQG